MKGLKIPQNLFHDALGVKQVIHVMIFILNELTEGRGGLLGVAGMG